MSQTFDAYSANYTRHVQDSIDFSGLDHGFFLRAKADLLRSAVAPFRQAGPISCLDVGCGIGALHPLLSGCFARIAGVDPSPAALEYARARNPAGDYRCFDGVDLPHPQASFDVVTAMCVFHHVQPPQWRALVEEMRRVTKPGGLVCIIEHNPWNPLTRLAVRRCVFDRDAMLLSASRTEALMKAGGLRQIFTRYFLFFPSERPALRRLEAKLSFVPLGAQYATFGVA